MTKVWRFVGILFCIGCLALSMVFSLNTYMLQAADGRMLNEETADSGYDCILIQIGRAHV